MQGGEWRLDNPHPMSKVKLGSALYKFRKAKGLPDDCPTSTKKYRPASCRIGNPNKSLTPPTVWSHKKYGVITANSCDLIRMFPQEGLSESGLSRVKMGKQLIHKGWTVFKKEEPKVSPYYKDLQERGA